MRGTESIESCTRANPTLREALELKTARVRYSNLLACTDFKIKVAKTFLKSEDRKIQGGRRVRAHA